MAELRSSTSIGGNLAWHTGNLRFDTQGNTIRYAGFKLYSENDKPTTNELGVYSKTESDAKYAPISGANYVSKTANETMAGSLAINGNELAVAGTSPRVSLTESDTGKTWWTIADGNDFSIREATVGNIVFNISAGGAGVNFNANKLSLNAKEAIGGADSWLRLNGAGAFTSGIFTGSGLVRSDGTIQTGDSSTSGLFVNTTYFNWKGSEVFTANNYTTLDARYVNVTGDTMTGPLTVQLNSASSNSVSMINETDGWTWMKLGKSALASQGHFAWNTNSTEGHAAGAFHFRPKGGNTVLGISTGAATIGSDSYLEFLPNSSWGAKLRVGGNGRTATNDGLTASVTTTNGNVHIDGASGSRGVYLNFYAGTAGTVFGNGAGGTVGTIDAAGNMGMNGTITAPRVQTGTINGTGSSGTWGSLDVTGVKGGWAGFNFTSIGYWLGVNTSGLAGVFDSAGNPKWYFEANGQLAGGATVLWNSVTSKPGRTNWASYGDALATTVGQLAWKNYGNNHTIFDASAGTSPDGTTIDKNNSQIAWKAADANYPTLMGWNGSNTYGVRVDSARVADSAISALPLAGGVMSGDITMNTYAIRGANGTAIVKDHGNGNTTFSGSRNAAAAAGDLYLGYHDNINHFTSKVLLCKSMYSDANQNLQIIDYSTGALFDKGAAVIGANRDNVLNNPSFGVGFLSAADSGARWIASYFGKNGGANQVVIGELAGGAVIGGHNAAKTAWTDLYVGTYPGGYGEGKTHISMPYARVQGNPTSYEILHRGIFDPGTKLDNNGHGDTLTLSNWIRSTGPTGWYNETYGGGIYMQDITWVRTYGSKQFHVNNTASNAIDTSGGVTAAVSMTAPTFNGALNGNASTATNASWANALSTLDANPNSRLNSGSYQNSAASTANGWPVSTNTWMHLLTSTHSNDSNYYSMQIAASFYNNTQLYYRSTNGNGGTGWAQIWTSAVFDPGTKANISGATFTGNVTAPTFNGLALNSSNSASTIVVRDGAGDINCRLLRSEYVSQSDMYGGIAFRTSASGDNYVRFCTNPAAVRNWLGVYGGRSAQESTIYTGSTSSHPTNNIINLSTVISGFNKVRFEFCNSGNTIAVVVTFSFDDWAALCNTGKLMHVAIGSYSYTFENAVVNATNLTRNTSSNCYLTKIVGIL